jgi:hypothetical protein
MIGRSLSELQRKYSRKRAAWLFLGLCYDGGCVIEPEMKGVRCRKHRDIQTRRDLGHRTAKYKAAAAKAATETGRKRHAAGLCMDCGKEPRGRFSRGIKCRVKRATKQKQYRLTARGKAFTKSHNDARKTKRQEPPNANLPGTTATCAS